MRQFILVEGEDQPQSIAGHREEGNYTVVDATKKDGRVYKSVKYPTSRVKEIFTLTGEKQESTQS